MTGANYSKTFSKFYVRYSMQDIEPHYHWKHLYSAEEDDLSPFYGREYSEFEYSNTVYNYYIHPQWDDIGSPTLFVKLLFAGYDEGFAVIELIGEWNDCLYNDIMYLKRELIDYLLDNGINKFIMIGENVFNFHYSDDSYYEEWFEAVDDGWIVFLNFREHVLQEFKKAGLEYYFVSGGKFSDFNWKKYTPNQLLDAVDKMVMRKLG